MKLVYRMLLFFIILFDISAVRIGSIRDHVFTYDTHVSPTIQSFENNQSCNICICIALQSTSAYKAINCYETNSTCVFIPVSLNLTNIISSINGTAYMLYPIDLPNTTVETKLEPTSTVTSSSTTFTTTVTSTASVTTTRTSSATTLTTTRCYWFFVPVAC